MVGWDEKLDEEVVASDAVACTTIGTTWWNQSFTEQTGRFHVEFSARPTANNLDTVVGLSAGPASKWASLAVIVRFNPQGTIDARSGSDYRADQYWPYSAGTRYYFRVDVDVPAHGYSVWVRTSPTAGWNLLAQTLGFRTEQASVTRLNNVASFTNPATSAAGGIELCGFNVVRDTTTTASDCLASKAGGGFVNRALSSTDKVLMVSFRATPSASGIDGVVGVAAGDVDAYDDLAASVRFYTNGMVEARDGDTYRADRAISYIQNREFDVRMFIDLPTHTYSVYVNYTGLTPNNDGHVLLASGYRFRPSQAHATTLDRLATIADAMGVPLTNIGGKSVSLIQELKA